MNNELYVSNVNAVFGKRLSLLRKSNNLTQLDFAVILSERLSRDIEIKVSTISSWETGRKTPNFSVIIAITDYFDISLDYLFGKTDALKELYVPTVQRDNSNSENTAEITKTKIAFNELKKYDNKPIYIVFINKARLNQWGILDYKNSKIIFKNASMILNPQVMNSCDFYVFTPEYEQIFKYSSHKPACDYNTMMNSTQIYVVMKTSDELVHLKYDGWYKHNEDKSMLINPTGLALPYEGFGVTYYCYTTAISQTF